jgi:methylphosphotriester-DNA--protein-cysteine methyltransferase
VQNQHDVETFQNSLCESQEVGQREATALKRISTLLLIGRISSMEEKFRTVSEVARILGVSTDTVRRLFGNESGVVDLGRHEEQAAKRRYRQLRIPEAVLDRVVNRKRIK